MGRPKRSKVAIRMRRIKALEMHLEGHKYRDIAKELGISVGLVSRDIKIIIDEYAEKPVSEYRNKHIARLEYLAKVWWEKALKDEKAVTAFIKIQERLARLLGMDSAEKLQVESTVKNITVKVVAPKPKQVQGEVLDTQKAIEGEIIE